MVEISMSGSGEGPGGATRPGYSTEAIVSPRVQVDSVHPRLHSGRFWAALNFISKDFTV